MADPKYHIVYEDAGKTKLTVEHGTWDHLQHLPASRMGFGDYSKAAQHARNLAYNHDLTFVPVAGENELLD